MFMVAMEIGDFHERFPSRLACIALLEQVRWGDSAVCPYCGSRRTSEMPAEHRHHCNGCHTSFSVTVGTVLTKTRLDLPKWFAAIYIIMNAAKPVSGRRLAREVGMSKDTACRLLVTVQQALHDPDERAFLYRLANALEGTPSG